MTRQPPLTRRETITGRAYMLALALLFTGLAIAWQHENQPRAVLTHHYICQSPDHCWTQDTWELQ